MKKVLALLTLLFPIVLSGCGDTFEYTPRRPYPGGGGGDDPSDPGGGGDDPGEDPDAKIPMTVYFYYDYSHTEEPYATMKWYMLTPLGECPEEAKLEGKEPKDPLYPNFIGYSAYSSCLDESKLWDFATDYYQGSILNLYGVWVSE